MSDTIQVNILNSDNRSIVPFNAYPDRLEKLAEITRHSFIVSSTPDAWAAGGVDSSAVFGMSLLFEHIPQKFPVADILVWLQGYINHTLPLINIEQGLIQFAKEWKE